MVTDLFLIQKLSIHGKGVAYFHFLDSFYQISFSFQGQL